MDVAAPPKAPAAPDVLPQSAPVAPGPLAVQQAPASTDAPDEQSTKPAATPKQQAKALPKGPHAPVALITIVIFVMLTLAALAVIVYLTSHPS
jgi:hypothetical protein